MTHKDENWLSSLGLTLPFAVRKESSDRELDLKTAENTNAKDLQLKDVIKNHLMKRLHDSGKQPSDPHKLAVPISHGFVNSI